MKRRTYLARAGAALSGAVLAGCSGESGDGEAGDEPEKPTPTPTVTSTPEPTPTPTPTPTPPPTPTATPEATVKIDKVHYTGADYPRELKAGMVMRYEVDVREGTSAFLTVSHEEEGEVFSESTRTQTSGRWEVQNNGLHYIGVAVGGKTEVTVVIR